MGPLLQSIDKVVDISSVAQRCLQTAKKTADFPQAVFIKHFSHSVQLDVECQGRALDGQQLSVVEGSGVAGDAGSLTPRCSATRIRCMAAVVWKNTSSLVPRPNHNHHQPLHLHQG